MSQYRRISVADAAQLIDTHNPLILDIRDAGSFQAARHPDAMNVGNFNVSHLIETVPKDRTLLIYCYHGHSSQDAAALFANYGFTSVYSLDGGFTEWQPLLQARSAS